MLFARQAKKEKKFHFYKVRHGITSVEMVESGPFVEITHEVDLVRFGLSQKCHIYLLILIYYIFVHLFISVYKGFVLTHFITR